MNFTQICLVKSINKEKAHNPSYIAYPAGYATYLGNVGTHLNNPIIKEMMNRFNMMLVITATLISLNTYGQNSVSDSCNCEYEKNMIFGDHEIMASFPGGHVELMKYLADKLNYPEEAKSKQFEDTVYVRFCVLLNGKITNVVVLKGKYEVLNKEALRVIQNMPNWEPAQNNEKPICSSHSLPIRFKLNKEDKKQIKKERCANN